MCIYRVLHCTRTWYFHIGWGIICYKTWTHHIREQHGRACIMGETRTQMDGRFEERNYNQATAAHTCHRWHRLHSYLHTRRVGNVRRGAEREGAIGSKYIPRNIRKGIHHKKGNVTRKGTHRKLCKEPSKQFSHICLSTMVVCWRHMKHLPRLLPISTFPCSLIEIGFEQVGQRPTPLSDWLQITRIQCSQYAMELVSLAQHGIGTPCMPSV